MSTTWNLNWDQEGERLFETGVDRCVLYLKASGADPYPSGVPWNGITGVDENPSGGDATSVYADNIEYLKRRAAEKFGATIKAYTYPPEFAECDGSASPVPGVYLGQQRRKPFGISYRSLIGNDEDDIDHGYAIHLVYGCTASPSSRSRSTTNESPEEVEFSWEVESTPVKLDDIGFRPVAHIEVRSTDFETLTQFHALENILYGTAADGNTPAVAARLPMPREVLTLLGWTAPAG